jgi:hypothetical protein
MRPRLDPVTGDPRRLPPTSWLVTRACLKVLATFTEGDRAVLLRDPLSRRAWHTFRDRLHQLDREHGSRAAWLHAPLDREPPRDPGTA